VRGLDAGRDGDREKGNREARSVRARSGVAMVSNDVPPAAHTRRAKQRRWGQAIGDATGADADALGSEDVLDERRGQTSCELARERRILALLEFERAELFATKLVQTRINKSK
jgi:hypothetical protein